MHIAIEVAHAPTGSVIALLGSPKGSPICRSTPAARMIPTHASVAAPAATVAPRLTSRSRPYDVRAAWVVGVVVVVDTVVVISSSSFLRTASRCLHPQVERRATGSTRSVGRFREFSAQPVASLCRHLPVVVHGEFSHAPQRRRRGRRPGPHRHRADRVRGGSSSGSSASGGYCDELKADKAYFQSLSGSNSDVGNLDT